MPANVQARLWHCLSVSRSVCPLGWMRVWLVNNRPGWLLIIRSAAEAGGLAYRSSRPRSPCDVISPHLVTLHYTRLRRPSFRRSASFAGGPGAEDPRRFHHSGVDVTAPVEKWRPLIEKHRASLVPTFTPTRPQTVSRCSPAARWHALPSEAINSATRKVILKRFAAATQPPRRWGGMQQRKRFRL